MSKLTHYEVSLLGAKAAGEKVKREARKRYYANPNHCQWCGEIIHPKEHNKSPTSEARKQKFCSRSCSAQSTNRRYPKRQAIPNGPCEKCGTNIDYKKLKKGGYTHRRFCDVCLPKVMSEHAKKRNKDNGHTTLDWPFEKYTKEEFRKLCPNYNYFGSKIAQHARKIYLKSGKPKVCYHCGYSYHTDICHVKDVSKFPGDTMIREINDISNLVALCKNHHKEFDDGFLQLSVAY